MSQQLRNRSNNRAMNTPSNDDNTDDVLTTRTGAGLSAHAMIAASPSHHGKVYKLQVPLLFSVLPSFLQRIICSWAALSFLAPRWKERFLIQIGNYVYRFKSPTSSTPKGAPIPLEQVDVRLFTTREDGVEYVQTPPNVGAIIVVSSYRKKQYYGVTTREEALTWINSIQDGKQEATRREMGHTGNIPYPKSHAYFDNLGKNLLKSKERIQSKIEESQVREMDMSGFGEGGALPRGYYG